MLLRSKIIISYWLTESGLKRASLLNVFRKKCCMQCVERLSQSGLGVAIACHDDACLTHHSLSTLAP